MNFQKKPKWLFWIMPENRDAMALGKLILTWDIIPKQEQEYFEFVVRDFLPNVQKLGFQLSDAWVTVYGDQPQVLVGVIMPSVKEIFQVLGSDEWAELANKLKDFVKNYHQKVTKASGRFQF